MTAHLQLNTEEEVPIRKQLDPCELGSADGQHSVRAPVTSRPREVPVRLTVPGFFSTTKEGFCFADHN